MRETNPSPIYTRLVSRTQFRFRGVEHELGAMTLEVDTHGDWNLMIGERAFLSGRGGEPLLTPTGPIDTDLVVDLRSLSSGLEPLTGEVMTYYPPGGWNAPDLTLHISVRPTQVTVRLDAQLDWDFNIDWSTPERPDDYEPRHYELDAQVTLRRVE